MESNAAAGPVVVVGAGVAGITTVTTLKQNGFAGRLVLLDTDSFAYDRPMVSKSYLTGTVTREEITLYSGDWFVDNGIDYRPNSCVSAIDRNELAVELEDGSRLDASAIVLATGGEAVRPAFAAQATNVHTVRTIGDADQLRSRLKSGGSALVVGVGVLGAEIAIAAHEAGMRVTAVDPDPAPMQHIVGERLARWLIADLVERGIEFRVDSVVNIDDDSEVSRVHFSDGSVDHFDVIVVAVGLRPVADLAVAAGLDVSDGIVVDDHQRTSDSRILAVGDCSRYRNSESGSFDGHWDAGKVGGENAAATILAASADAIAEPSRSNWFWTDRGTLHLDVVARIAEAEQVIERGTFGSESFILLGIRNGTVVSAAAINDPKSARVLRKLVAQGAKVPISEIADPAVPLKSFLTR